jgi:RimJ/RimL family protein N-acetyltransferase
VLPVIETERLQLRGFVEGDASVVQKLAGDRRVAETTAMIPHPYEDGLAEAWIATHEASWELGRGCTLAVVLRESDELIGAIGLSLAPWQHSSELGYWIGPEFWRRGYCTEAARALIAYGFTALHLERIHAHHFARNVASGRVLEKAGMTFERLQPRAFQKWGRLEDLRYLAITREQWEQTGMP